MSAGVQKPSFLGCKAELQSLTLRPLEGPIAVMSNVSLAATSVLNLLASSFLGPFSAKSLQ